MSCSAQKYLVPEYITLLALLMLFGALALPAYAQQPSSAELAQANNPLASITAINLHNYYIPTLYGIDDEVANTFWIRYAQPVGRVLIRSSLPLSTVPTGSRSYASGLGDFNAFAAYLAISKPTLTFGVGPLIAIPTATEDALGAGKWQGGAAVVVFAVPMPQLQFGGLLTWQTSFAGDDARDNTNFFAAQPFAMWQLGGGTYLRSTGIWAFNLETGDYNVPFGLGIGRVTDTGKIVYNLFAEPQFTILHKGTGQPGLQFFFGLNMQIKRS